MGPARPPAARAQGPPGRASAARRPRHAARSVCFRYPLVTRSQPPRTPGPWPPTDARPDVAEACGARGRAAAADETQKRRHADPRLPDRREDAAAQGSTATAETSFAAPRSISSPLATASLCARTRGRPRSASAERRRRTRVGDYARRRRRTNRHLPSCPCGYSPLAAPAWALLSPGRPRWPSGTRLHSTSESAPVVAMCGRRSSCSGRRSAGRRRTGCHDHRL